MNDTLAHRERTSSRSAKSRQAATGTKPVLASEVLRDDVAPYHPGKTTERVVLAVAALALLLVGMAVRAGLGPIADGTKAASLSFAVAGAALASALLPLPYAVRACVSALLGLCLLTMGLREAGPLAALGSSDLTVAPLSRLVAMTALPAALFFRATYRAYGRARLVLSAALALSLPFAVAQVVVLLNDVPLVLKIGALLDVIAVACGLIGFMGEDTTAGGVVCGSVQIGVLSAGLALLEFVAPALPFHGPLGHGVAATGLLVASTLVSVGLYQLLAALLATDARRASLPGAEPEADRT